MRKHGTGRRRCLRRAAASTLATIGLIVAGGAVFLATRPVGSDSALAATSRQLAAPRKQMAIPVRISIPAIRVEARVVALGLNRDRTIQVPKKLADTGWFRPGPEPGEQGAAVIVGHVASLSGPGVFARLKDLRAGAVIRIHLQDRSTLRFIAGKAIRVSKTRFPTKLVYANTARPTLRLITCAGKLNPVTGHHADNYIVFASLDSAR
jgi:sortase (surface protein transpeptidase)